MMDSKRKNWWVARWIVVLWILGCGASTKAPRTAEGKPVIATVFLDRGQPGVPAVPGDLPREAVAEERDEFSNWVEHDLVRILNDYGYVASFVRSRNEYVSGPETCLIEVLLKSYVPANRSSRTEAGLGEGFVSVDLEYQLFVGQGKKERRLSSFSRRASSARSWEWVAGKLNEKVADDVNKRLAEALERKR
jgi:hypothetical protein